MVAPCGPCGPWASWQRPPSPSVSRTSSSSVSPRLSIWAIALLGPGAAVRCQRPVLLRPGRPLRHRRLQRGAGRHPHRPAGLLGAPAGACWSATPRATGWAAIAGRPRYLDAGADQLCARHRLPAAPALAPDRAAGPAACRASISTCPTPPGGILSTDRWLFLMALALLAAGVWLAANLIASRSGRALMAARDDDLAAAAQGIRVVQVRATASGIAGAYLALAGCLSAYQFGYRRADRLQLRALGADAVRPGDRRHAFAGRRDRGRPVPAVLSRPHRPASARACRPCSMPCC